MRVLLVCLAAAALAACGNETLSAQSGSAGEAAMDATYAPPPMAPPPPVDVAQEESARGGAAPEAQPSAPNAGPGQSAPGQNPGQPAPVRHLAYSYNVGIEAPAERVASMMDAHARACESAGPAVCQVIGSGRDGDPETRVSGMLSLRAAPAWLTSFMARLESDAESAGGRIRSQSTSTEDLTRAIVDTEATLAAQRALRNRLQRLLESRPGRLSDLLEVERELARVQGQIDSYESNLAVMRTRVAMSALTIGYESAPRAVGRDTFRPLTDAFSGFVSTIVIGLSLIVTLIAALIPWAVFLGLIGWGLVWLRRRRGGRLLPGRRANAEPPPTA